MRNRSDGSTAEHPTGASANDLDPQLADLPSPPGAFRRALREHPRATDRAIVALYLIVTFLIAIATSIVQNPGDQHLELVLPDYLHFPKILLFLLIVITGAIALLVRRSHPMGSLVAALLASIITPDDMAPTATLTLTIAFLLYSVPIYRSARAGWIGYLLTVLALIPSGIVSIQIEDQAVLDGGAIAALITLALLMMVPVALGINSGNRRRYTEAIIDRAHQLARERDQLARLAVAEERTRIAREMHDIVAHSVSVMVTLSEGAARAATIQPDEAVKAMQQSAETGRAALTEMRRLIGVLREPGAGSTSSPSAELAPMPGTEDLPELIKGFRAAGLTVDLTLKGRAPGIESGGAQGRDLTVYRTVQEALTNALRYAGAGTNVSVLIDQNEERTRIRVDDDGGTPGHDHPMTGLGSGQGLVGLAERLRVFGGSLEYGPRKTGGWYVEATLPLDEDLGRVGVDRGRTEGIGGQAVGDSAQSGGGSERAIGLPKQAVGEPERAVGEPERADGE
ncbi:histidine kinase [Actinomycetaceae bacterium L2_0104]